MYPQTCDRVLKPRKGHQEHNQPAYNVGSPSTHPRNVIGMTIRRWADGGPLLDVFFFYWADSRSKSTFRTTYCHENPCMEID